MRQKQQIAFTFAIGGESRKRTLSEKAPLHPLEDEQYAVNLWLLFGDLALFQDPGKRFCLR